MPLRELPRITWEALPALLMPVILLGGTLRRRDHADRGGRGRRRLCAADLRRALPQRPLPGRLSAARDSARVTASIGMLIAGALVFNYVITIGEYPEHRARRCSRPTSCRRSTFLLLVNVLLLVLGCLLEGTHDHPRDPAGPDPDREGARHRPGALRRHGRGEHHDRADHAAVRPAAVHDDQDRRTSRCATWSARRCRSWA